MREHQMRVSVLAIEAWRNFRSKFSHLSEQLVTDYISLHDGPKVLSLGELQSLGYDGDRTLMERLAPYYGFNRTSLPHECRADLESAIRNLNQVETEHKSIFFLQSRIGENQRRQLFDLERVADVTDTGISRGEELGISLQPYDGARFLQRDGVEAEMLRISRWLEDNYLQILIESSGFQLVPNAIPRKKA